MSKFEVKNVEGKRLANIDREDDVNADLSFRNIPKTWIITPAEANTYDLINNGAIVSERSYSAMEENKYTFEVAKNANKFQIKDAIEELFGVKVVRVNTLGVKLKCSVRKNRKRPEPW